MNIDEFEDDVSALGQSLDQTSNLAAAFSGELTKMQQSLATSSVNAGVLSKGMSNGLRRAIDGAVSDGLRLSDVMHKVGTSLVSAAYSAAIKPVTNHFGQLFESAITGALGTNFGSQGAGSGVSGRVQAFAKGGVVTSPTQFGMRGGTGLMGEAGPEAIMPLTRGPDGALGVRMQGGGSNAPVRVVMNISTPDVAGFQRAQAQVFAQLGRALAKGQRTR